jgi:hypothetical protein
MSVCTSAIRIAPDDAKSLFLLATPASGPRVRKRASDLLRSLRDEQSR